jgi:hypothetical protein
MVTIRLAVRDWDYFTPLALGDIKPEGFTLEIDRVGTLVDNLATSDKYDAGEVSSAAMLRHVPEVTTRCWACRTS